MFDGIITIRASSLGRLFDCPASWSATHIDGKRTPSNGKAMLGKAVHASTAVFDQSGIDGTGISIDEAAAAAVDAPRQCSWPAPPNRPPAASKGPAMQVPAL